MKQGTQRTKQETREVTAIFGLLATVRIMFIIIIVYAIALLDVPGTRKQYLQDGPAYKMMLQHSDGSCKLTFCFTWSQCNDIRPTSSSTDTSIPGAWQDSHMSTICYVTGIFNQGQRRVAASVALLIHMSSRSALTEHPD